jgi:hypothetical protein
VPDSDRRGTLLCPSVGGYGLSGNLRNESPCWQVGLTQAPRGSWRVRTSFMRLRLTLARAGSCGGEVKPGGFKHPFRRRRADVSGAGTRRRPLRGRRRAFVAAVAVIMVFGVVTARLFVWPAQGLPGRVSAIVVLAGPGDRLSVALRLAREHQAPTLVVSQGWQGYGGPCPPTTPGVKIICFEPNPGDTRGEAEFIGRLAKRSRWHSVVLVTDRAQDTRARVRVRRCFNGSVYVVTASLSADAWPYAIAYEWAALFKALVLQRAC